MTRLRAGWLISGLYATLLLVALGQLDRTGAQVPITINSGTTLPGGCQTGGLYVKTGTAAGLYYCSATDTWTGAGTQSPTLVTPALGAATATSIAVTGATSTGTFQITTANVAAPGSTLCDAAGETGLVYLDSTADVLYVCSGASGWRAIATAAP